MWLQCLLTQSAGNVQTNWEAQTNCRQTFMIPKMNADNVQTNLGLSAHCLRIQSLSAHCLLAVPCAHETHLLPYLGYRPVSKLDQHIQVCSFQIQIPIFSDILWLVQHSYFTVPALYTPCDDVASRDCAHG